MLMERQGSILTSTDLGADSVISLDCIEGVPGGGYILGGTSSVSPSFTVIHVDPAGQPRWIARVGHDLRGIHARDALLTDAGSNMRTRINAESTWRKTGPETGLP